MTYETILEASRQQLQGATAEEAFDLIDSARVNADDTIAEKEADASEWESLFIGTLVSNLCCRTVSTEVAAFFAANGIEW